MKWPTPVEPQTNAADVSLQFVSTMKSVYELSDQLLNRNGGVLDCRVYDALVDAADNGRDGIAKLNSKDPNVQSRYMQSLMDAFSVTYGKSYTKQEIVTIIETMTPVLDTFVPAAAADQPKDATTGCLFLVYRNAQYEAVPYIVDPMPQSTLDLVLPLFNAFE